MLFRSGLIYAVITSYERPDDFDLILFRHENWENGSPLWADYSDENQKGHSLVGKGDWKKNNNKEFKKFFADESGSIYAVDEDGALWWWHHNRRFWGEPISEGALKIGEAGWDKAKFIFSGFNGVIYSVIK